MLNLQVILDGIVVRIVMQESAYVCSEGRERKKMQ